MSARTARRWLPHALLALIAFINLVPLYYMVVSALQRGARARVRRPA